MSVKLDQPCYLDVGTARHCDACRRFIRTGDCRVRAGHWTVCVPCATAAGVEYGASARYVERLFQRSAA